MRSRLSDQLPVEEGAVAMPTSLASNPTPLRFLQNGAIRRCQTPSSWLRKSFTSASFSNHERRLKEPINLSIQAVCNNCISVFGTGAENEKNFSTYRFCSSEVFSGSTFSFSVSGSIAHKNVRLGSDAMPRTTFSNNVELNLESRRHYSRGLVPCWRRLTVMRIAGVRKTREPMTHMMTAPAI